MRVMRVTAAVSQIGEVNESASLAGEQRRPCRGN